MANDAYKVKLGEESNASKGKRFEVIVNDILKEKYNNEIDIIDNKYFIEQIKLEMDFYIVLKSGKHLFIEAKYRNGSSGKGLCKDEATHSVTNAATLVAHYCKTNNIDYKFYVYTNGVPKKGSAGDTWLTHHTDIFNTIHEIVLVKNCEDTVESVEAQNNLENCFG
jgi:hypothetical protein